jgi:uncharacterized protein (UPF0332 family)
MTSDLINKFLREGRLRKQEAGFVQIESLLKEAIADLKEAKKIASIAERATYIMAYMAMLKAGRALLLMNGYVPDDGAQHKTVVEITGDILGKKYEELIQHYETMRRKRNEMTYEAGTLLSKAESEQSFKDAIDLVRTILAKVKAKNPQLELNIKLD